MPNFCVSILLMQLITDSHTLSHFSGRGKKIIPKRYKTLIAHCRGLCFAVLRITAGSDLAGDLKERFRRGAAALGRGEGGRHGGSAERSEPQRAHSARSAQSAVSRPARAQLGMSAAQPAASAGTSGRGAEERDRGDK